MSKFKVGDVVRCVDNYLMEVTLTKGKEYIVTKVLGRNFIELDCGKNWSASRFELVEEKPSYTQADVERAIDVFEHFDIRRSNEGNYNTSEVQLGSYAKKERLLKLLFENPKVKKVKEIKAQMNALQTTINQLEKEINNV